jgi:nucleoside-diphosphate-sugar epimerase
VKLVVVGGSGFIGRQFLEHADLSGFEVSATYHSDSTFPNALNRKYDAIHHDLLGSAADFSSYDAAVYMAGNSNHTWALDHLDGDMSLNAVGLARFLASFRGHLVLLSTGAVYFGHEGLVSPASSTAPLFPYGASKLAGELLAGWGAATGRLRSLKVLRLYYAFGPGEEERRLIRRALTQFGIKGDPRFRINGTGQSLMAPMHVTDVAGAIELALKGGPPGTYDLPSSRPYTVREIVETAASVCGVEPDIELVPSSEATLAFFSEQQPFAKAFGFAQRLSLEAGMKQYLEDLRREPAG